MSKINKILIGSVLGAIILTSIIALIDPLVSDVNLMPDTGPKYYYWQLANRNPLNMLIVWILFGIHLLGNIHLIRNRQQIKSQQFTSANLQLILFNLLFVGLHIVQSIIGYDGLAQDVSVFSSQYSVILVLVLIILIQSPQRGLIFGHKLHIDHQVMSGLYRIHGILFTVAIVYTFWFHPTINTIGHLLGFFYIFLLFIQISMFRTKIHTNRKWIVGLEVLVAIHGASVAYFVQNSKLWAMFLFGFGFIFVATQIYALTSNKAIIHLVQSGFVIVVGWYYLGHQLSSMHQVLWIPIIIYGHVLALYGLIVIGSRIAKKKLKQ